MAKIVAAFVSASPSNVYKYLSAHASSIIANLVKNMMHCGTLNVIRFLLDVPLESAAVPPLSPVDGKPWWGESNVLIDPFVNCLANPDMAYYAYYFFVSVIQRATVFVYALSPLSTVVARSPSVPRCNCCRTC